MGKRVDIFCDCWSVAGGSVAVDPPGRSFVARHAMDRPRANRDVGILRVIGHFDIGESS